MRMRGAGLEKAWHVSAVPRARGPSRPRPHLIGLWGPLVFTWREANHGRASKRARIRRPAHFIHCLLRASRHCPAMRCCSACPRCWRAARGVVVLLAQERIAVNSRCWVKTVTPTVATWLPGPRRPESGVCLGPALHNGGPEATSHAASHSSISLSVLTEPLCLN